VAYCDSNNLPTTLSRPENTSTVDPLTPFRDDHDTHRAFISSNTAFSDTIPMNHDASNDPGNPTYNTWAPRDDSARVEAECRKRVRQDHLWQQQQQQQAAFQAQQQRETQYAQIAHDVQLTTEMQGLGYGQSNPDPEQIRLASETRTLQQRLHQMEQMMAALRQQNLPAPAPAPPYYGGHATPPPTHFGPPPRNTTHRTGALSPISMTL
jgi:hypothetical protein